MSWQVLTTNSRSHLPWDTEPLTTAGSYTYFLPIHPHMMTGRVIVG